MMVYWRTGVLAYWVLRVPYDYMVHIHCVFVVGTEIWYQPGNPEPRTWYRTAQYRK